jgi:hypothetical protein
MMHTLDYRATSGCQEFYNRETSGFGVINGRPGKVHKESTLGPG